MTALPQLFRLSLSAFDSPIRTPTLAAAMRCILSVKTKAFRVYAGAPGIENSAGHMIVSASAQAKLRYLPLSLFSFMFLRSILTAASLIFNSVAGQALPTLSSLAPMSIRYSFLSLTRPSSSSSISLRQSSSSLSAEKCMGLGIWRPSATNILIPPRKPCIASAQFRGQPRRIEGVSQECRGSARRTMEREKARPWRAVGLVRHRHERE